MRIKFSWKLKKDIKLDMYSNKKTINNFATFYLVLIFENQIYVFSKLSTV